MNNENYTTVTSDIRNEMILEARSYAEENRDIDEVEICYTKFFGNVIYITFDGENIEDTFDVTDEDGERVSEQLYEDIKVDAYDFVTEYNAELEDQVTEEQYRDNMKSLNAQYESDKI